MTVTADRAADRAARIAAALTDPAAVFTAAQVADLMATAARWGRESVEGEPSPDSYQAGYTAGYRARMADENAAYPPPPIHFGGVWIDQADHRRRAHEDALRRRRGDYRGGPLRAWPATWCGDYQCNRPHVVTADGERFRCQGRR